MSYLPSRPCRTHLPDGLYQVTWRNICAGFVVRDGLVHRGACAPILWPSFARGNGWERVARRVGP